MERRLSSYNVKLFKYYERARPRHEGQTANLAAEAGHDLWTNPAGADAEPIPELEFDQTLGL